MTFKLLNIILISLLLSACSKEDLNQDQTSTTYEDSDNVERVEETQKKTLSLKPSNMQ